MGEMGEAKSSEGQSAAGSWASARRHLGWQSGVGLTLSDLDTPRRLMQAATGKCPTSEAGQKIKQRLVATFLRLRSTDAAESDSQSLYRATTHHPPSIIVGSTSSNFTYSRLVSVLCIQSYGHFFPQDGTFLFPSCVLPYNSLSDPITPSSAK